jgi:branched-chain amino acid transport system ATP-binding protein
VAEPLLQLEGVTKRYGALIVSDEVSLDVRPGEIHALIGPNGAGKTTLIQEIAGRVTPDSGRILLRGEDVTDLPADARARRGLGRTFQTSALVSDISARAQIELAIQSRSPGRLSFFPWPGRGRAAALEADAVLDRVGLLPRADIIVSALSHGERRALELATALALQPKVLVLDEPLAGVGRDESRELVRLIASLRGSVAILLVEHDMDAVFRLADRISVLVYGQIIATGEPREVRADPLVRAAYLGEEDG